MASKILSKYVVPGSKVDIRTIRKTMYAEEDMNQIKDFQSQVYDVISEERIEILMPMEKSKIILLPIGGEYDLFFYSENGLYQCKARVMDRSKKLSSYILVMELTSNLRKDQRREFYRFSCALGMNSRVLEKDEVLKLEKDGIKEETFTPNLPIKRSVIVDISGGGLRFVADYAYEEGAVIACKYQLETEEGTKKYDIPGVVLSVKENINRPGVYEHRVKYINIDNDEREEIIKYIFEEERKKLKKKGPE